MDVFGVAFTYFYSLIVSEMDRIDFVWNYNYVNCK